MKKIRCFISAFILFTLFGCTNQATNIIDGNNSFFDGDEISDENNDEKNNDDNNEESTGETNYTCFEDYNPFAINKNKIIEFQIIFSPILQMNLI